FAMGFVTPVHAGTPEEARAHILAAIRARQAAQVTNGSGSTLAEGSGSGGTEDGLGFRPMDASSSDLPTNGLILSITPTTNSVTQEPEALLTLFNTTTNSYQLLSKPSLDETTPPFWPPFWGPFWIPGQVTSNDNGTNQITFDPVPTDTNDMSFFRAVSGDTVV